MIELHGVVKRYPHSSKPILDGLDLTVEEGQWLSLTGPSGSGKTTLLRLLYGAEAATAGEVIVLGRPVAKTPVWALRRQMGLIFQSFELLPEKTALENVAYGGEVLGWPPKVARDKAAARLAALGLEERFHHFPRSLSGGEQQRVGIARALIHEPRLILADEPTGDLDLGTARHLFDMLIGLQRDWHATLLVSTHSPELVRWAGGRVFDLGPPGETLRSPQGGASS